MGPQSGPLCRPQRRIQGRRITKRSCKLAIEGLHGEHQLGSVALQRHGRVLRALQRAGNPIARRRARYPRAHQRAAAGLGKQGCRAFLSCAAAIGQAQLRQRLLESLGVGDGACLSALTQQAVGYCFQGGCERGVLGVVGDRQDQQAVRRGGHGKRLAEVRRTPPGQDRRACQQQLGDGCCRAAQGAPVTRHRLLVDRGNHRVRILQAVRRLRSQQAIEQSLHPCRGVRPQAPDRRRRTHQPLAQGFGRGAVGVGGLSGQHLVQEQAERVQVAAAVERFRTRLLRREVVRRADHRAGLGHAARAERAGDAEIADVGATGCVEQHVGRLEVTVDDAALVRRGQAQRDLARDPHRFLHG